MHPRERLLETWCLDETECRSSHSSVEIQKLKSFPKYRTSSSSTSDPTNPTIVRLESLSRWTAPMTSKSRHCDSRLQDKKNKVTVTRTATLKFLRTEDDVNKALLLKKKKMTTTNDTNVVEMRKNKN